MGRDVINVQLGQGVDIKTDPKAVDLGDLISSQNLSFATLRSLQKRNGNLLLPTVTGGIGGLAVFNATLLAQSNYGTLYSASIVNDTLESIGTMQPMSISTSTLQGGQSLGANLVLSATASALLSAPSAALPNPQGIQVTAWESSLGGLYYQVADIYSGALIVPPTQLGTGGISPRCLSANNQVVIFWVNSTGSLVGTIITAASPSTSSSISPGSVAVDLTNPIYDVAYAPDTNRYWIVYKANAHAIPYVISLNGTTLATVTATIPTPGITDNLTVPGSISIAYQGSNGLYVFTTGSTGAGTLRLNFTVLNNTPASVASGTSASITALGAGPVTTAYGAIGGVTALNVLFQLVTTATPLEIVTYQFNNAGASSAFLNSGNPITTHLGLHLVSNFYGELVAGVPQSFGVVSWVSPEQATYFVVDQSLRIHGKFLAQTAGSAPDSVRNRLTDFQPSAIGGGIYPTEDADVNLSISVQDQVTASNGDIITYNGVQFVSIDFAPQPAMLGAQLGQNVHLTGGQLWNFDGNTLAEHGFHIFPELATFGIIDAPVFNVVQSQPAQGVAGINVYTITCPPASVIANGSFIQLGVGGYSPGPVGGEQIIFIFGFGTVPSLPFGVGGTTAVLSVLLTQYDSATTVAQKINNAASAGGLIPANYAQSIVVSGNAISFSQNIAGGGQTIADPARNSQEFSIRQVYSGAAGNKQIVTIQCPAAKYLVAGQYFAVQGNTLIGGIVSSMVVWFRIAGIGSAPSSSGYNAGALQVTLTGSEQGDGVATAIKTAINAAAGAQAIFTAQSNAQANNEVELDDKVNGLAAAGGWNVNAAGSLGRTPGTTTAGIYSYAFTYRWVDLFGQIHQSAPSPIITVPIGPEQTASNSTAYGAVYVTFPTLRVTDKSNVTIDIWRSVANGSVLYRVTSTTSPIINNPAVDSITYHDTLSDDELIGSDLLYTTGELANQSPPGSCQAITKFQNRLVLAGLDDGKSVAISQVFVPGQGIMFNGGLDFRMDQFSGPITAISVLDSNLILFDSSQMAYVNGQGPDPLGNGLFSVPQLIEGQVGCLGSSRVARSQLGLVFVSAKGIYLLDRSLSVNYIGAPVEGIINGNTVTSVLSVSDENEVRFFTQSGITIVWNYFIDPEDPDNWVGRWTTYTTQNGVASVNWQGSAVFADSVLGAVLMENPGSYLDGSTAFTYQFETGWIDETGKRQGFQNVFQMLLQGLVQVGQAITVDFQYDGDTTYTDTVTWTPAEPGNGNFYGGQVYGANTYGGQTITPEPITSARINNPRRQVSQIKVRVTEAVPANLPLSFTALTFEIQTIEGVNRTGFSNVAG
jgi:hypothetical protein